jgi:hypothetical protein
MEPTHIYVNGCINYLEGPRFHIPFSLDQLGKGTWMVTRFSTGNELYRSFPDITEKMAESHIQRALARGITAYKAKNADGDIVVAIRDTELDDRGRRMVDYQKELVAKKVASNGAPHKQKPLG